MGDNILFNYEHQKAHLDEVTKKANSRYLADLNVELPIVEIFDAISRNRTFYVEIEDHRRKLFYTLRESPISSYDPDIWSLLDKLESKIECLSNLIETSCNFNAEKLPWDEVAKIVKSTKGIQQDLYNRFNALENAIANIEDSSLKNDVDISDSLKVLTEIEGELEYFHRLATGNLAKLSNSQFLLLTGEAGMGKTHLLCSILEKRTNRELLLPTILAFGNLFNATEDPLEQIILQLDLRLSSNKFLDELDKAAEKTRSRALIMIDGLNETPDATYWKGNLIKITQEIEKYPNIALIVSVRTGFKEIIIEDALSSKFSEESHPGFQFREWEALNIFCRKFNYLTPDVPTLTPVFQNPLFLYIFCKSFEQEAKSKKREGGKKRKQIFRGHEGANYIFEQFVNRISKNIVAKLKIRKTFSKCIWEKIIKEIARNMVSKNTSRISERKILKIISKAKFSVKPKKMLSELEANSLILRIPEEYGINNKCVKFSYTFLFDKFSNHIIGRYLFKEYKSKYPKTSAGSEAGIKNAKKFFAKSSGIGKFISDPSNRGIIEMLSIQWPEYSGGHEFIEVAPYLRNSEIGQKAFISSLCWRNPDKFLKPNDTCIEYIRNIRKTESGADRLLDAFLSTAIVPKYPFNAEFLHRYLSKFSMPKRDIWWSTFLHRQSNKNGAVERLIEWGYSTQNKSHIASESIYLYSLTLTWFLTTPNRFIRDKATKALVAALSDKPELVLCLLKKFKSVNDIYITERLYAVAHGCAIRSENKEMLKETAKWIYSEIFNSTKFPVDLFLYGGHAQGIVSIALHKNGKIKGIDENKIKLLPKNTSPIKAPTIKFLKNKYFPEKAMNRNVAIWNSIMGDEEDEESGHFWKYTIDPYLERWEIEGPDGSPEKFDTSLAQRWILNKVIELGWKFDLHEDFDNALNSEIRSAHKAERIGKKYQWIAFYEFLSRIPDNSCVGEHASKNSLEKYEGPWEMDTVIHMLDIDPSDILKKLPIPKPEYTPTFESFKKQNALTKGALSNEKPQKIEDLPNLEASVKFQDDDEKVWVALNRSLSWTPKDPHKETYHSFSYGINSYLIDYEDKKPLLEWITGQDFMRANLPTFHQLMNTYFGQYPLGPMPHTTNTSEYCSAKWVTKMQGETTVKILPAVTQYSQSGSSIDCSSNKKVEFLFPSKLIIDELGLTHNCINGSFFNEEELVAFEPDIFDADMPKCVLVEQSKLLEFLESKKYSLFWTLRVEEYSFGPEHPDEEYPIKFLRAGAVYFFDDEDSKSWDYSEFVQKP